MGEHLPSAQPHLLLTVPGDTLKGKPKLTRDVNASIFCADPARQYYELRFYLIFVAGRQFPVFNGPHGKDNILHQGYLMRVIIGTQWSLHTCMITFSARLCI
jgi:hypothetical protein